MRAYTLHFAAGARQSYALRSKWRRLSVLYRPYSRIPLLSILAALQRLKIGSGQKRGLDAQCFRSIGPLHVPKDKGPATSVSKIACSLQRPYKKEHDPSPHLRTNSLLLLSLSLPLECKPRAKIQDYGPSLCYSLVSEVARSGATPGTGSHNGTGPVYI